MVLIGRAVYENPTGSGPLQAAGGRESTGTEMKNHAAPPVNRGDRVRGRQENGAQKSSWTYVRSTYMSDPRVVRMPIWGVVQLGLTSWGE